MTAAQVVALSLAVVIGAVLAAGVLALGHAIRAATWAGSTWRLTLELKPAPKPKQPPAEVIPAPDDDGGTT
jgi:hypothetical protein